MMKVEQNIKTSPQETGETSKFTRDVVWIAIAQLFSSMIIGIVTLPALTKSYSTEMFGIWSQAYVTAALLSPIFCLELDMAVVRFLAGEKDKDKMKRALGSMLFSIMVLSILAFIAVNILATQLSVFLFASPEYTIFVRLTFLWVIFYSLFVFLSAYLRARNRMRLLSIRSVMVSLLIMVLIISLASQKVNMAWIIGSVAFSYAVMVFIFLVMIIREVGWPMPNVSGLKSYLTFSIPQIPGFVLLWLIASSDRYFITHFLSLSQAGIYSSSNQLASMTRMFYSPVTYVLYPTLAKLWDEDRLPAVRSYLEHSIRLLLTLGIPAAAGIALLSQPLLDLLTTADFLAGDELVLFISIGTIFLGISQINGHIILLEKRTKVLPLITAAAAIVSVGTNILLIPRIGILGAGVSNIASYFVLAAIMSIWAGKSIGYNFDFKYLGKVIAATIPMAACLYYLRVNSIWGILVGIIAGIFVYGGGLILLKAFSDEDKQLIKKMSGSLMPGPIKRRILKNL